MNLNRRKFIKRLVIAAAAIEAIFLFKGGVSKINTTTRKSNLVNAGKIEDFENNKQYPFLTHQFVLKRFKDGGFMALSQKCTHLGCIIHTNVKTGGFNCPCHASQFNDFGEVLSAPATRPLDIFPIKIEKGEIYVDISKSIKRTSFSKSQITYL